MYIRLYGGAFDLYHIVLRRTRWYQVSMYKLTDPFAPRSKYARWTLLLHGTMLDSSDLCSYESWSNGSSTVNPHRAMDDLATPQVPKEVKWSEAALASDITVPKWFPNFERYTTRNGSESGRHANRCPPVRRKNPPIVRFGNFEVQHYDPNHTILWKSGWFANLKPTLETWFWGSMHVAWACHTKRAYLQNLSGCANEKTVRVSDPWTAIIFFFAASPRMRNVQPQTGTFNRNWRPQLFGQYCFAWFLIFVQNAHEKIRVYVGQANVISKWPTG